MMCAMQQDGSFFQALGHGQSDKRIAILRQIGAGGSISQAARSVGVSYKAAWQALDTLTNLAGVALVERVVGGAGGGGARLTPAGQELLDAADAMHRARAEVVASLQPGGGAHAAAARLQLRTSMRNQWPCTVQEMQTQGQIVRVLLRGADEPAHGLVMCARITRESAELLGLAPGVAVQALCKATAVRVQAAGAVHEAGINQWPGRVTRVARGALGDEVAAELASGAGGACGMQMVGFAAPGSGLRARSRVLMTADEAAVALALG